LLPPKKILSLTAPLPSFYLDDLTPLGGNKPYMKSYSPARPGTPAGI